MFGFRSRRRRRPQPPAVSHVHHYTARFLCTLPWQYKLLRESLDTACTAPPALATVADAVWRGHAATIEIRLEIPWALPSADRIAEADAYINSLIGSTTVASWLLHLERDGDPVPTAEWAAIADHPDLARVEAHCDAFYEVGDDGR